MEKKYSSGLVSESFWFVEMKELISLRSKGISWDELKEKCIVEHLLGRQKEYRTVRIFGYLKRRISFLDEELLTLFTTEQLSTQKLINLIAIAKGNRLLYEFLYSEYRPKLLLGVNSYLATDMNRFFSEKQQQEDAVADWKEPTLKRIKSTYFNFLTSAGLFSLVEGEHKFSPPVMDFSLEQYLKINDPHLWKAISGVE